MPGFAEKGWKGSRGSLLNSSLSSYSSGRSNSINYGYSDALRYRSHPNILEIANQSRRSSDSNGVLKMDELLSSNLVLEEGQTYRAHVSHIVEKEAYTFFLQLGNAQEILIPSIKRSLEDSPRKPVSGMIFPGMCLMGNIAMNSEPRRCIVTEVYNFGCKVFFCDYGNSGEIPFSHLYQISHEATQIKPQAIKFTLADKELLPDDPKTFDFFKNVLLGAQVQITIVAPIWPVLFCNMEFKGCDVKEMILSYLAPLYYLPQVLPSSDDTKVFVTHVESAGKFYVQYASKLKLVESIQNTLNETYSDSVDEGGAFSISIGSPVAVFDEETNSWCRGLVSEMMANFFHVLKVDFGNTIKVEGHFIREIRKRSLVDNFRTQAIECGLYDFEDSLKNSDVVWDNVIRNLVPKKFYKMIVLAAKPHHLSVDLFDEKGESVGNKIKAAHKKAINGHDPSDVKVKQEPIDSSLVNQEIQVEVHRSEVPDRWSYKFLDLKAGTDLECYFVTLISPKNIYVQPTGSETILNNMGEIMRSIALSKLPSDQVSLFMPVVTLFADDGNFYRGMITNITNDNVTFLYIDYGNSTIIDKSDLYVLPDELKSIPAQAVNVRFQNLEVGDNEDLPAYQAIYEGLDLMNLKIKSVEIHEGDLIVYSDAPPEVFAHCQTQSTNQIVKSGIVENGIEAPAMSADQQPVAPQSVSNKFSYNFLDLKAGTDLECYFITLISPKDIYVQPTGSETIINNMGEILRSIALSKLPSDQVSLFMPVVTLFADDGNFYRGMITNITNDNVTFLYIDYGNSTIIDKSDLYVLPDELKSIPAQAVNVRFQNLEVGDNEDLPAYQAIYEGLNVMNLKIKSVEIHEGDLIVYSDAPPEVIAHCQTQSTNQIVENGIEAPAMSADQLPVAPQSVPNKLSYNFLDLKAGTDLECYFITLISPKDIYVQPTGSETIINNMGEIMRSIALSKLPSDQVSLFMPVVTLFADDGNFYRGMITNITNDNVTFLYIDYGNSTIIDKSDLYVLPDELKSIPAQAVNVRFQNLEVGDNEDLPAYQVIYERLDVMNLKIKSVEIHEGDLIVYSDAPPEVFAYCQTQSTNLIVENVIEGPAESAVQPPVAPQTVPNKLSYHFLDLKAGTDIECYFVTLISRNEIFVQLPGSETILSNIGEIIGSVALSKLPSDQVSLFIPVVTLFADDGNFYRGIITNITENLVTVLYADYGNSTIIDKSDLYILPDELKDIPAQAVNVRFQNLPEVGEDLAAYQAIYEGFDTIHVHIKSVENTNGVLAVGADASQEILTRFKSSDMAIPVPQLAREEDPYAVSHDNLCTENFDEIETASEEEIENVTIKEIGSIENTTGICLDSSNLDFSTFTESFDLLRGQHFLVTLLSQVDNETFIVKIHPMDLIVLVQPVQCPKVSRQFIIYVLGINESSLIVDAYDVDGEHMGDGASICPIIPRPIIKREQIVFISHLEGESIFISRDEDRKKLDSLLNETFDYYENNLEVDKNWQVGALCCAKASDGNWYRARILENCGPEFKVKFIDYGNSEIVGTKNLRDLSYRFYCEPELCIEIKLPVVFNENAEFDSAISSGTYKTVFYKKENGIWICDLIQDDVKLTSKLEKNIKCFRPEYLPEGMPVGWNFQVSETHKAYVTTVNSINAFYIQLEADIMRIQLMQESLKNFNGGEPNQKVFAALYADDGAWYRAVDVENGVLFIDYGNIEPTTQKKPIPYKYTFPEEGLALLVNFCVKPIGQTWPSEAIQIFNQFIENRVEIKILSLMGRVVVDVISVKDSISLSGILINGGYAKFTDFIPEMITDLMQKRSEIINKSLSLINRSLPKNELIGTKDLAYISFLKNVDDFYIQYVNQMSLLEQLKKMLIHAHCFDTIKNVDTGDVLCVQHADLGHEGKVWYRGEIVSKEPLRAILLDYGPTVDVSDVRLLPPEIHNIPQLAVHCSLDLNIPTEKSDIILINHETMLKLCEDNIIVDFHTNRKPYMGDFQTKRKPYIVTLKSSDGLDVFFHI